MREITFATNILARRTNFFEFQDEYDAQFAELFSVIFELTAWQAPILNGFLFKAECLVGLFNYPFKS